MGSDPRDDAAFYASPPCFMHEGNGGAAAGVESHWPEVRRFRKAERERILAERLSIPAATRAEMAGRIAAGLDTVIGEPAGRSIGLYWPFRGEPDLRPWLGSMIERGASAALPVVVEKKEPLIFRAYRPGDALERGVWNIPVPAAGAEIIPDIIVSPLVGFDSGNYRLGYGGGFYDRTLAAMARKPLVIGIGYAFSRLATIYPQPHDIPMDSIVTEEGPLP